MKILLDTCVLADMRRPDGHAAVKTAVAQIPDADLFLSVLTVGEIVKGIALLAPGKKQEALTSWLNGLETQFLDRILPVDSETTRLWGALTARAQTAGIRIPGIDGLVAATALQHGLHIMTRNSRHFESSGASIIDPWKGGSHS